jgi:outer membrane protein
MTIAFDNNLLRVVCAVACVVVCSVGIAAQSTAQPLTLQDCLRLAEGTPNAITLAQQERAIADRDLLIARAGMLPQSEVQHSFIYNSPSKNNRAEISFIPLNAIREYALLGTVTQEFDTSGRMRAEMSRARANQTIARANYEVTLRDLRRAVTTAFYRLLLTRRLVTATRASLAESRQFEARTKLLVEGGESARADLVKASAQAAALEQSLNAAELEAQLANQELASFWTKDSDAELNVADTLNDTPTPLENNAQNLTAYLKRPEFKLLAAERSGFEADARVARAALRPQLNFVFQYGIDSTSLRFSQRGYAAYFNLRIPVFDWFRARSQTEQFNLRAAQVETNRVIAERVYSREYQSAALRVKQFFAQLGLTQTQIKLAEEDLHLSRVRYEGGEGSALDVVTAQQQLAVARGNYFTALANYLNARADLEVAAGR